jgi:hypothetical protein
MGQKDNEGFESSRFEDRRESYNSYKRELEQWNIPITDFLEHFPSFVGHMSLSRTLGLYELYKKTLGLAGHVGEVGIYKGASLFLFAKLVRIFEPEALTQVHGFDWFQGSGDDDIEMKVEKGSYKASFEKVRRLIQIQDLDRIVFVHKIDVVSQIRAFFDEHQHLQFKMFFLDAGFHNVVRAALPVVWERLTPGGILILDQYNHELAPGETMAIRELLPHSKVYTLPDIWMPTGYIIKD